jgi:VanZ family protein
MQKIEPANRGAKIFVVALSLLVLAITLSAGLWPFSFQMNNEVWWKPEAKGLHFGDHGMLISGGTFSDMPVDREKGCSIELWVEPGLTLDSSTLLAFYGPTNVEHVLVRQSGDDVVFTRVPAKTRNRGKQRNLFQDHVFRKGQRVLITFTSKGGGLDVYVDSVLKRTAKNIEIKTDDFNGILIVGNSPFGNLSWMGTFRGLAFYDRALRPEEVRRNLVMWQSDPRQLTSEANKPYSLYLFDEQAGDIVHNLGRAGPDLVIPKHYFIFQQGFLVPFWEEYRPNWDYARDLAINIFGLVPLGFCFAAVFARALGRNRSLLYTTILGFCVSLTIEVFQAFMPTRFSGTTDLITNTTGTALGAWLYLNAYTQNLAKRLGLIRAE